MSCVHAEKHHRHCRSDHRFDLMYATLPWFTGTWLRGWRKFSETCKVMNSLEAYEEVDMESVGGEDKEEGRILEHTRNVTKELLLQGSFSILIIGNLGSD